MVRTDIGAYVAGRLSVPPQSASAGTISGFQADRVGFLSCVLAVATGAPTGSPTAISVVPKLQHSDDGTTWDDFATGSAITAGNTLSGMEINIASARRYIRARLVVSFTGGTSPAVPVTALIVLGGSDTVPVSA